MKYEPNIDAKKAGAADLAKSGRWVSIQVFSLRLEWGRNRALAVLQSLMADGLVEMQDVPSGIKCVGDERQYRIKPGADLGQITGNARPRHKRPSDQRDEIVHALVLERGTMTANEVAEDASLTQPTARGVLARLEAAGRLSRFLGPAPATGSRRPWCYHAPAGSASR